MSLPKFEVIQPQSVEEACGLLAEYGEEAAVLAGGTDILVDIRKPIIPAHLPRCKGCEPQTGKPLSKYEKIPQYLISLSHIPGLKDISIFNDGSINIGACATITEICESVLVRQKLTALAEGGDNLGSPLVRNRGTIGGNICNARPAADCLVASYALNASLELASSEGIRTVSVADFVTEPGKTILRKGEILTRIVFPAHKGGSAALKLANRKVLEIAVVNTACWMAFNEEGKIAKARIVMGAAGPTPIMAVKAMKFLEGKEGSDKILKEASIIASQECRPITDHRGSALYRIEMAQIIVERTLKKIQNAKKID